MIRSRMFPRSRRWIVLLWTLLLCLPLIAQAQALSGLHVLPHAGLDHSFSGWQSEGALPPALTVPLDLGDEVYGVILQLQPTTTGETYRVRVQYETSLGLSAAGPHLDLTDWKHCVSNWETAAPSGVLAFVLPTPTAEQHECFPAYTQAELENAVHDHARSAGDPSQAARWLDGLRTGSTEIEPVTPFVAINAVRVQVEVLRKGEWEQVAMVTFLPPMGC